MRLKVRVSKRSAVRGPSLVRKPLSVDQSSSYNQLIVPLAVHLARTRHWMALSYPAPSLGCASAPKEAGLITWAALCTSKSHL